MPKLVGEFYGNVPVEASDPVEIPYYVEDKDLEFLKYVSNEDLDPLVEILTSVCTEELTQKKVYKKFYPDHRRYWKDIAAEIQTFGGNTFANIFRGGRGVLYKEILTDVCKKLEIEDYENKSVIELEKELLLKIIGDQIEGKSLKDLNEMIKDLEREGVHIDPSIYKSIENLVIQKQTKCPRWLAVQIAQIIVKKIGFWKINKLVLFILNELWKILTGKGLSVAANAMISRILGKVYNIFTGPIGWGITITWSIIDLAGPAFRVTVPCCFYIAFLRRKYCLTNENF